MDEKRERGLRRRAVRLWLQGLRPQALAARLGRSQRWLHTWCQRYQRAGRGWARSRSRRPHRPFGYDAKTRAAVIRVRKHLTKRKIGLLGAKEIHTTLRAERLLKRVPALSTIQRMLHEGGLIRPLPVAPPVYFPQPTASPAYVGQGMDWTSRYVRGGAKVYAFHTLDLETRGLQQTLSPDKSRHTVRQHVLTTWQRLGLGDGLQMDNDAACCGGDTVPRVFGALGRLCLFVGVEPIFLPVGEPARQAPLRRLV